MSKEFTIKDYSNINPTKKMLVDDWILKYELENVHTVKRFEDTETLVCLGFNTFKLIRKNEPTTIGLDNETDIVIAVIDYDDFPWEVLDNA